MPCGWKCLVAGNVLWPKKLWCEGVLSKNVQCFCLNHEEMTEYIVENTLTYTFEHEKKFTIWENYL
mgnify:CR=1 FL=1